jgi:hypothetical protein
MMVKRGYFTRAYQKGGAAGVPADCVEIEKNRMSTADRKAYWDLRETLHWVCRRGEEGVAAMRDMKEGNRIPLAMFSAKAVVDPLSLPLIAESDFEADDKAAAWQPAWGLPDIAEFDMIGPGQALNYLLRQVHNRHIRMTAIKCDRYRVKQIPVPPVELNDLEFRITPGHRVAKVGLWSRSRNSLMLRSPQFLRADVIRVWPARKKKNAAVSGVILRHLQAISTSAAPLTKADAQRRCLAEVPNAYPRAFDKAWAILDPSCKRGRGKHGARGALSRETCE